MGDQVQVQADTQLVLGGLLHQQGELLHEVAAELVLLWRSRHHSQPDGLSHAGHGVEVADGHPGDEVRRGREGWKRGGHGERMKEKEGKREKTDRERTDTLLSLGVNKRDLSSQSFAVCAEAMGDPWLCVCDSPTNLRALTHRPVSRSVQCVCVCIFICMWLSWGICPLRRTGVSMERGACWWACLGWGPSFDTGAEGNLCSLRNVKNQAVFSQSLNTDCSCWTLGLKKLKCKDNQKNSCQFLLEDEVFWKGSSAYSHFLQTCKPKPYYNCNL